MRLVVEDDGSSDPGVTQVSPEVLPGLGDEVRDGGLTFVVDSFSCQDEPGLATPDTGCLLFLSGTNHGAAPAELFGGLQYVIDDAGRRHGPEEAILEPFLVTLNPEETGALALTFFLPSGSSIRELEVHGYPGSLGARIQVAPS